MDTNDHKVTYGKPLKKFRRPALSLEDDSEEMKNGLNEEEASLGFSEKQVTVASEPARAKAKSLLEQAASMEIKPSADVDIVDKRLLLSTLSSLKREKTLSSYWRPYSYIGNLDTLVSARIRKKYGIIVDGADVPAVIPSFQDMRIPEALHRYLHVVHKISEPSLIQMQGIPAALSGRDVIGIASTGTGKTLAFCIPLIIFSLEQEMKLPFESGEGPVSMILAPSRELARQIFDQFNEIATYLRSEGGFRQIRVANLIGGLPVADQISSIKSGVHIVVGTPGRIIDFLDRGQISLHSCRHICLDEADRMLDMGFEENLRKILSYVKHTNLQMLLFSATMPNSIKEFAKTALSDPVVINVSRAGAVNLDIVQEVELVQRHRRLEAVLEALQKTAPPVIIFAASKGDVDDVAEYLLLRGIEAVSIHGGKTQEERLYAIDSFKSGEKDVLVASDIASKGMDLKNIQHVINYDMPTEIEDYVHRIGRTGRGGRTGIATTLVDPTLCSEEVMLDLKHLLDEAEQFIPPFLAALVDKRRTASPCSICGGLGHEIDRCPKITTMAHKQFSALRASEHGSDL